MSKLRQFSDFTPIIEAARERLPVGGYVGRILMTKVEDMPAGDQKLIFRTEIIEGPYTGFYRRDYERQLNGLYVPKYRGDYEVICSETKDGRKVCTDWLMRTIGAIESSNAGYQWHWDEASLSGLLVGLSVREAEYQGHVYTEIGKFVPLSMIRNGTFQTMPRKVHGMAAAGQYPQLGQNTLPVQEIAPVQNPQGYANREPMAAPVPQGKPAVVNDVLPNMAIDDIDIPF